MNESIVRNRPKPIQATITGKNQITIPAAIVRALELEPGMQLEFEIREDRTFTARPALSRAELARQLQGKWRYLLAPGDDPIAELIREREEEDEDID
jgi:AbrB family looped-hinge helix DNA binding protein